MQTFRLKSLMLVVTLVACCLGVNYWVSPLGYVLLAIGAPAGARTLIVLGNRMRSGEQPTTFDKVEVFTMSCLILVGVGLATVIAFLGAASIGWIIGTLATGAPEGGMLFGVAAGSLATALLLWQVGRFVLAES